MCRGARNRALLDLILPAMRRAAKDSGYALTVHGTLNRDIDLVAVPWVEHGVKDRDTLVSRLIGAIGGVTGRCNRHQNWEDKPHGMSAVPLLVWCGEDTTTLDLSVMPALAKEHAQ